VFLIGSTDCVVENSAEYSASVTEVTTFFMTFDCVNIPGFGGSNFFRV